MDILGILGSGNHLQARARASYARYECILVGRDQGECAELPLRTGWYVRVQENIMHAI